MARTFNKSYDSQAHDSVQTHDHRTSSGGETVSMEDETNLSQSKKDVHRLCEHSLPSAIGARALDHLSNKCTSLGYSQ
jgi:hypothetical protein